MDFGRVKTVLIFLFIFLNIFLLYYVLKDSSNQIFLSKETINQTKNMLSKNNIELKDSVLVAEYERINYLNLSNPEANEKTFANILTGTSVKNNEKYKGSKGVLSFYDDIFLFEPSSKYGPITSLMPSHKTAKKVLSYLKKAGIETDYFEWAGTVEKEEGIFEISFIQKYGNYELYNSGLTCTVKKDGLYKVKGKYFVVSSQTNSDNVKSPAEILIKFNSLFNDNQKRVINNIDTGFYINPKSQNYSTLTALPCYKIILKDGKKYFYDAVDGNLINFTNY